MAFTTGTKKYFSLLKRMWRNSRRLTSLIWRRKKGLIIGLTVTLIITGAMPFIVSGVNGLFINNLVNVAGTGNIPQGLVIITFVLALLLFIRPLANTLHGYVDRLLFLSNEEVFVLEVVKKSSEIDIAVHESPRYNNLLNRVEEQGTWRAKNYIDRLFYLIQDIFQVLLAVIILFATSWKLVFVVILFSIPELIVEAKHGQVVWGIDSSNSEAKRRYWNLKSHFQRKSDLSELKLFQNTHHFISQIRELYSKFISDQYKAEKGRIGSRALALTLSQVAIIGCIIFLAIHVVKGGLLIGTFTFLTASIWELRSAISSAFNSLARQYEDDLYMTDLIEFLDIEPKVIKPYNGIRLDPNKTPAIEFRNVSFVYPDTSNNILENISFKLQPGEKMALVGVNGAGKTTLVKLLCRFYDPTEGKILIDGHDLKEIDIESWYHHLGVLFQDYSHYYFAVKDAISIGRTSTPATSELIQNAAKQSESDMFIEEWDKKYEQMLGKEFEGGIDPSVGQWQKLALARTFYRDARVLILDEPTSSIDAEAEANIFERLEKLPRDHTVILISHRFSTVRHANKIMVIGSGKITELGTHEELMALNGTYARLFTLQAKGYK